VALPSWCHQPVDVGVVKVELEDEVDQRSLRLADNVEFGGKVVNADCID